MVGVVEYFDWTHFGDLPSLGFVAFLFWGYFVVKNLVQVTVAISVARWWGLLPDSDAVGGGPCSDFAGHVRNIWVPSLWAPFSWHFLSLSSGLHVSCIGCVVVTTDMSRETIDVANVTRDVCPT